MKKALFVMIVLVAGCAKPVAPAPSPSPTGVYYASCEEAVAAGKAPLKQGQPGYREALDRDGDGVACDK